MSTFRVTSSFAANICAGVSLIALAAGRPSQRT